MSPGDVGGQTSNFRFSCRRGESGAMEEKLVITVEGLLVGSKEKFHPTCGFPELHPTYRKNDLKRTGQSTWSSIVHRIKSAARTPGTKMAATAETDGGAETHLRRMASTARRVWAAAAEEVLRCVMENMASTAATEETEETSRVRPSPTAVSEEAGVDASVGKPAVHKRHFPLFIVIVSCIQILSHGLTELTREDESNSYLRQSPLIFDPYKKHVEIWRYFSYMFLHANLLHLLFNLLIQLLLGIPLEVVHGHMGIAVIYLAGGFAGALGTTLFEPNTYILGASAGVYALLTAHVADIILNYPDFKNKMVQIFTVTSLAIADVAFTIYHEYSDELAPKISWSAHCNGAICGLLVGMAVLKARRFGLTVTSMRVTAVLCLVGLLVAAAVMSLVNRQIRGNGELQLAPGVFLEKGCCDLE